MNGADLAKAFAAKWKAKNGRATQISYSQAGAFFKQRLTAGDSAEDLLALMDFFFDRFSDSFARRRSYDFVAFRAVFNALLGGYEEEKKKIAAQGKTDTNFEALEEARRKAKAGEF